MFKKLMVVPLAICLLVVLALAAGCAVEDEVELPDKDKLVFGGARPLSGPLAIVGDAAFKPLYEMWVDEVNARGGIYVEEYGKKLEIDLRIHDDTSDMGTMTRLLERLIVEDEVDFLLPPCGTAFLKAAAPIANDHGYLLLGAEGGALELEEMMADLPYFFSVLNYSTTQVPPFVEMIVDAGMESVAIMYIADQHGIEYSDKVLAELEGTGIEVVFCTSVPPGVDDVSALINEAKAADADVFMSLAYPDENFLAVGTSMELGYNPKVFVTGPGFNFQFAVDLVFGPAAEGVMSWGAWNAESSKAAADFVDRFIEYHGGGTYLDWWGHLFYYASLEVLEQAIEIAGTIDHAELKEVIATEKFDTVMGEIWFENGGIAAECHPGQVGQWQDGVYEVIAPADKSTADPVIPKPAWPAP